MLHFYTDKKFVPEGMEIIKTNDKYFNAFVRKLKNNPETTSVLSEIEEAKYFNETIVIEKFWGLRMASTELSTGTKTVLNILSDPLKCFDLIECGDNVIRYIINNLTQGNVLCTRKFQLSGFADKIIVNGRVINDINEFAEVLTNV